MEFVVDGFCNFQKVKFNVLVEQLLVDCVQLLMLIVLEMIVLVGGLWMLGVNYGGILYGVFIDKVDVLLNDFFVNLLDMVYEWVVIEDDSLFEGCDCKIGEVKWIVICVDLVFGLNL